MRTKNIRKVLVDNAKYYRFKIGYTQEELAEKCDMSREINHMLHFCKKYTFVTY